jgi:hypothetical protein
MTIRGKVTAVAVALGAAIVTAVLLWPTGGTAHRPPTSDEIKASAQARLDASLPAGRAARANIQALGKTPDDATCQSAWDNTLDSEQRDLSHGMWMVGCTTAPSP